MASDLIYDISPSSICGIKFRHQNESNIMRVFYFYLFLFIFYNYSFTVHTDKIAPTVILIIKKEKKKRMIMCNCFLAFDVLIKIGTLLKMQKIKSITKNTSVSYDSNFIVHS